MTIDIMRFKTNEEVIINVVSLLSVGFLWGATNPFIKRGSQGIERLPDSGSRLHNAWNELRTVGSRLQYWIPFLLNQLGSALFVYALQNAAISVVVPVANSLSFVFTAITGYFLGEKLPGKNVALGTVLICFGSLLMIYDKILQEEQPAVDEMLMK